MPDYGYGGGGQQSPLSLYSMLYPPPARGQAPATQPGYGLPSAPTGGYGQQQPQIFQQRSPQQVPWWAQMFWNNPNKATDPEKKDPRSEPGAGDKQAMQMGQIGLQMLQPRPPTHTGPYPWI